MAYRANDSNSWSHSDSSGTTSYVPNLFSSMLLKEYYEKDVMTAITNNDADSSGIKEKGDRVTFRKLPAISISDHAINDTITYERLTSTAITLIIDRAKRYAFKLDDIDKKQMDMLLDSKFIEHARKEMSQTIQQEFLADMVDEAHASNLGLTAGVKSASINLGTHTSPLPLTKSNILDFFEDMKLVLAEQDVQVEDSSQLFVVVPPAVASLVGRSDLNGANFNGGNEALVNKAGFVGQLAGFNIMSTNSVPVDGSKEYDILFCHKSAICYAMQLAQNQLIPQLETQFGCGFRGMMLFGWKVLENVALGNAVVTV